jgi:hypothetical protein
MRSNYSLSSQEINDILYKNYRDIVYLIGYENQDTGAVYSGVYDHIETSGNATLENTSIGIPHVGSYQDSIGSNLDNTSANLVSLLKIRYIIDRVIKS